MIPVVADSGDRCGTLVVLRSPAAPLSASISELPELIRRLYCQLCITRLSEALALRGKWVNVSAFRNCLFSSLSHCPSCMNLINSYPYRSGAAQAILPLTRVSNYIFISSTDCSSIPWQSSSLHITARTISVCQKLNTVRMEYTMLQK